MLLVHLFIPIDSGSVRQYDLSAPRSFSWNSDDLPYITSPTSLVNPEALIATQPN